MWGPAKMVIHQNPYPQFLSLRNSAEASRLEESRERRHIALVASFLVPSPPSQSIVQSPRCQMDGKTEQPECTTEEKELNVVSSQHMKRLRETTSTNPPPSR